MSNHGKSARWATQHRAVHEYKWLGVILFLYDNEKLVSVQTLVENIIETNVAVAPNVRNPKTRWANIP